MNIKNSIRKKLFMHMPPELIEKFYKAYYKLRYPDQMKKKCSFGNLNGDKTFFIIRPRKDCIEGLLSLFWNVVRNIDYAENNNYIPVVDFQNYKTQYSMNATENVWDYYFTQPSGYSLKEVYESKNAILSGWDIQWYKKTVYKPNYDTASLAQMHSSIFRYIDFSEEVKKRVEIEADNLGIDFGNAIGLYLRGTDYIKLKPSGHPVQPTVSQAIEVIDKYCLKHNPSAIFLVTEDGEIYDRIKAKYGATCITPGFDKYIYGYDGNRYLSKDKKIDNLADTPYERGMVYLVKMILLSKCGYLIGGNTNGMWAVNVFAEHEFKDRYIFDLGLYGK